MEERAFLPGQALASKPLYCSRIIREFVKNPSAIQEYDKLSWGVGNNKSEDPPTSLPDEDMKIMTECHKYLMAMGETSAAELAHSMLHHDPSTNSSLIRFLCRLRANTFVVADGVTFIGHGVMPQFGHMNHSCHPNAVHTTWLRPHLPPMLQLTVVETIPAGQEITLSYSSDVVTEPHHIRRETLWREYRFICDCSLCKDTDRDDKLVGLKCTQCTMAGRCGMGRLFNRKGSSTGDTGNNYDRVYQCNTCGSTSFGTALKCQAESLSMLRTARDCVVAGGLTQKKECAGIMREIYNGLKQVCHPETSWHCATSAKFYLCCIVGLIPHHHDEGANITEMMRDALVVMDESKAATKFCFDVPGNLHAHRSSL